MYHFYDQEDYEFIVITNELLPVGFIKIVDDKSVFLTDMMQFNTLATILHSIRECKSYNYFNVLYARKVFHDAFVIIEELSSDLKLNLGSFDFDTFLESLYQSYTNTIGFRDSPKNPINEAITNAAVHCINLFVESYIIQHKLNEPADVTYERINNLYRMKLEEFGVEDTDDVLMMDARHTAIMFNCPPIMDIEAIMVKARDYELIMRSASYHHDAYNPCMKVHTKLMSGMVSPNGLTHTTGPTQILDRGAASIFREVLTTLSFADKLPKDLLAKYHDDENYTLVTTLDVTAKSGTISNGNAFLINMLTADYEDDAGILDDSSPLEWIRANLSNTDLDMFAPLIKENFTVLKTIQDNWFSEYVQILHDVYTVIVKEHDKEFANTLIDANFLVIPCPKNALLDSIKVVDTMVVHAAENRLN